MPAHVLWALIGAMGLLTYAMRLSFILVLGRMTLPARAARVLRLVPPAVLAALITPELLRPAGVLLLSPANGRLVAGILAALVAWRTRSVFLTIVAGLGALWVFRALLTLR